MLRYDAWYCKVSRLTFDGQGKANGGLVRAGSFSTYCEVSDIVFTDIAGIALNLGNEEKQGQAEHAVLRCTFRRCNDGGADVQLEFARHLRLVLPLRRLRQRHL